MTTTCLAIAKSGVRCKTSVVAGSQYCYLHDPAMAERRREGARRGGANRSNKARALKHIPASFTGEELAGWLSLLFTQVIEGQVEPRIGTAAATIARTLMDVKTSTDLEQRLSQLEGRAGIEVAVLRRIK
jgi:hypothetical protein